MNEIDLSQWLPDLEEHVWLYLQDWAWVYLVGGGIMTLIGILAGWTVWGRSRSLAKAIERKVAEQRVCYEEADDQLSRLEKETSPTARPDLSEAYPN